jgi:chemotaxis protein CheX
MSIAREDLQRIVTDVWQQVLGLEAAEAPPPTGDDAWLTACIQITGAWRGAVIITAPPAVARAAAVAMFQLAPTAIGDDEARDALGELANMVGGHVKALLPGPSQLALPVVTPGREPHIRHALEEVARIGACADGQIVLVRVLEDVE